MDDIINDNARAEDDDEEEGVVINAVVGEQAAKKKKGSRGTIWMTKEDECMVE